MSEKFDPDAPIPEELRRKLHENQDRRFGPAGGPKTLEEALAQNAAIGGSRTVTYRDLVIVVPLRDIEDARKALTEGNRHRLMRSVRSAIDGAYEEVAAGRAPHSVAMNIGQDIAIWFANEVIEGRATLEVN
jgi:hypothetical protein